MIYGSATNLSDMQCPAPAYPNGRFRL